MSFSSLPYDQWIAVVVPRSHTAIPAFNWCFEHLNYDDWDFVTIRSIIIFKNKLDAMAFKIKFKQTKYLGDYSIETNSILSRIE